MSKIIIWFIEAGSLIIKSVTGRLCKEPLQQDSNFFLRSDYNQYHSPLFAVFFLIVSEKGIYV